MAEGGSRAAWITAGATILAALIAGVIALIINAHSDPTAAQLVQRCETAHRMQTVNERTVNADHSQVTFLHCAWPPPPAAADDGYTKIISKYGKGPGLDDASGANVVDRIIGPCANYSLSYSMTSQGGSAHLPPFTLKRNAIVDVQDPGTLFPQPLPFKPERPETDVVRSSNYTLDDASCV